MRAVTAFVNELGEFVVYDPYTHELRVFHETSGKTVSIKAQPPADNRDLTFHLPNRYAPLGLKSLLRVTDAGRIQVQDPAAWIADLSPVVVSGTHNQGELQGFFDSIIARLNDILAILVSQNIVQPSNQQITPEPASVVFSSNGPLTITPAPAVMVLSSAREFVPTFTLGAVDPTVLVG